MKRQSTRNLFLALLLLILSAYISITLPISEKGIPFTAQSLIVFYLAGMLNPRRIALIIGLYLILGGLGLPIFADGSSGFSKLASPSGGFLYGFLFAGLFISMAMSKLESKSLPILVLIMFLATILLFIFGLCHLGYKFGWTKALEYGLYPFWKMALVKAFLASLMVFWSKPDLFQ